MNGFIFASLVVAAIKNTWPIQETQYDEILKPTFAYDKK
jgi:hypothetical protein